MKSLSHVQLFVTPWTPWDFPGKSTGVGCHFLLQGIFPTQGSNPGLLHCRQTLYHLSHQGSSQKKGNMKKKNTLVQFKIFYLCNTFQHDRMLL